MSDNLRTTRLWREYRRARDISGPIPLRAADALRSVRWDEKVNNAAPFYCDGGWYSVDGRDGIDYRCAVEWDECGWEWSEEEWSTDDTESMFDTARHLGASRSVAHEYAMAARERWDTALRAERYVCVVVTVRDRATGLEGVDALGGIGADDVDAAMVENDMVGNALADLAAMREGREDFWFAAADADRALSEG